MHYKEETGIVVDIREGETIIRLNPESGASCGMGCKCCSAASGGPPILEVEADDLEPGDKVEARIPQLNPYLAIFFTFGLPLILFVVGFFVGNLFEKADGGGNMAILGGIIGFILAFLLAWIGNRLLQPDEEPVVKKTE